MYESFASLSIKYAFFKGALPAYDSIVLCNRLCRSAVAVIVPGVKRLDNTESRQRIFYKAVSRMRKAESLSSCMFYLCNQTLCREIAEYQFRRCNLCRVICKFHIAP